MIKLLVAGEGNNELGATREHDEMRQGVVRALLEKVRPGGWEIRHTVVWSDIRKLRVNIPGKAEGDKANVLRLLLRARDLGCHAVVFVRDRDRDHGRERAIEEAIRNAPKLIDPRYKVVGGVAVEDLEAWLLALQGVPGTESLEGTAELLEQNHGIPKKRTGPMVNLVYQARLPDAAADASSLWRWLRRAAVGLHVRIPKEWPKP